MDSSKNGVHTRRPDWSDLPPDLVNLLGKSLTSSDFFRFRGVCSSWRSAASPRSLPNSFPLLACPVYDNGNSKQFCLFASISSGRILKPSVPNSGPENRFIGCSNGWLVAIGKYALMPVVVSLLNPLTGVEILFPPLRPNPASCIYIKKIVVSSPATVSAQISSIAILGPSNLFALARAGASAWEMVSMSSSCEDVVFFSGRFHIVDEFRRIFACEEENGSSPRLVEVMPRIPTWTIPHSSQVERCYLADLAGELVLVVQQFDLTNVLKSSKFRVLKMDPDGRNQWMEVTSFGGRSLFLGLNSSISVNALEQPGCRENCIYFTENTCNRRGIYSTDTDFNSGVFNLSDRTVELFPTYLIGRREVFSRPAFWFLPSLI